MNDELVKRHVFVFNPKDNGGESLMLVTEYFSNGDPPGKYPNGLPKNIYTNQELTLQSYCNAASFTLTGASLTPEILRKLANELDQAQNEAYAKTQEMEPKKVMSV